MREGIREGKRERREGRKGRGDRVGGEEREAREDE